tara:strand:+ start:4468 stop:7434 length:2967 start_codon:yes stop_codon:yes gene_type:complete
MGLPGFYKKHETPLTVVFKEFKAKWGRAPNPSEQDYIFWALGGTTKEPGELTLGPGGGWFQAGPGGLRFGMQTLMPRTYPSGRPPLGQYLRTPIEGLPDIDVPPPRLRFREPKTDIDSLIEGVAYKLGYDPYEEELLGTPQTAAEFMKTSFSRDELFPERYVTDVTAHTGETFEELSNGIPLSSYRGDLYYDEFYEAVKGHLGKPPTEGQIDRIRAYYFNSRYGEEVKSYTELRNGIAGLFEHSTTIDQLNYILNNAAIEIDTVKAWAAQGTAYSGGNMRYVQGGGLKSKSQTPIDEAILGKPHVTPDNMDLGSIYRALYYPDGVSQEDEEDAEGYIRDIADLAEIGADIRQFKGRQKYSERVMHVLLNYRNPQLLGPTTFHKVRMDGAILTALDNLVESGKLPASAISNILNKASYMNDMRSYVTLRVQQDERLFSMTGSEAVEFLLDDIAIFLSDIEKERIQDTVIPKLIDDRISAIEIQDETLQHQGAISVLKARKDEMVTKILLEKANHEQHQDMLEDTAAESGLPPHRREEFNLEAAADDLVAKIWRPLEEKSLASVKEAADAATENTRRLRETNDAAMYLADQANIPGWDTYKRAAQLAWTAQGKDPKEFSAALMQRFTDNASDPSLALGALSRSLFESGAFGITTPDGTTTTTSLRADFTALLEGQTTKEKSLKILGEFGTVEGAIDSPRGRAALEAMAPGLTPADKDAIAGLEAAIGLVTSDPASAAELGTVDELKAQIAEIEAAPAMRFKVQLDARAKGIPLPNLEAQFGYDTGGVEISQEAWANARAEKEKMRMELNVDALMAGVEEWQKPDVYKFLAEEGGLELLRGQYEGSFAAPDQYYYAAVAKAREAAGLVGVDTDEPLVEPEPYFDAYPELTEPGTYEVSPGVTVTIPEGGKKPPPEELEPGELSRRTLFAQTEGFERARSVERRKARGETFQKFLSTALPEAMKARTARIAGFKGSKLVKGTALTGGRRVRF